MAGNIFSRPSPMPVHWTPCLAIVQRSAGSFDLDLLRSLSADSCSNSERRVSFRSKISTFYRAQTSKRQLPHGWVDAPFRVALSTRARDARTLSRLAILLLQAEFESGPQALLLCFCKLAGFTPAPSRAGPSGHVPRPASSLPRSCPACRARASGAACG